jgi:hypothetical protein
LCCPANIITVIKSRKIRWAEHVACTAEEGNVHEFAAEKLK